MYVDTYIYIYRERSFVLFRAHHPAQVCHAFFPLYCLVLHLSERRVSIAVCGELLDKRAELVTRVFMSIESGFAEFTF